MRTILDLFRHMHWADATVWSTVLDARQSVDDDRLRKLLYHIHMVQRAFLRVWNDPEMKIPKLEEFPSLAAIGEWAQAYHAMLPLYLETVMNEDLDRIVVVPWARFMVQRFGKNPKDTTLGETMLQVAMHSIYHRGQVNTRLRELDIDPPLVDYIAWLWLGRPEAEWPDDTAGAAA